MVTSYFTLLHSKRSTFCNRNQNSWHYVLPKRKKKTVQLFWISFSLLTSWQEKYTGALSPFPVISTLIVFEHMLLGRCLKNWICNSSPGSFTKATKKGGKPHGVFMCLEARFTGTLVFVLKIERLRHPYLQYSRRCLKSPNDQSLISVPS